MALPFPHPSALLPPGFTMSRCAPADVPGMTAVCEYQFYYDMRAFPPGSPFTFWWAPSVDTMREWHANRIRVRFADPSTHQFKVVDDATGAVVAFAKWDPPAGLRGVRRGFVLYDEEGREVVVGADGGKEGEGEGEGEGVGGAEGSGRTAKKIIEAPEGADKAVYEDFFGRLKSMAEKWRANEKLALSILCTDPAYRGRGIGAALIKSVLDLADDEGLPAYVEAMPKAVPLYRRQGFVEVDTLQYDQVLTIMVREPRSGVESAA
ncbi:acyl-CoA N-acyltransferase [Hypoxylon sp. FL0543]|nr:acyl-CoA N-acyltransferase [Hypoxylon sp. FL0543]